ncbi:hypothetical protein lerEdw1_000085 [Lerista edwardsae]|nr:hypothetical protein lerEdw1_000085 [Lerista edwardsae]
MERSSVAVGAVRRLRTQASQQPQQRPEREEDGRDWKKSVGAGVPRGLLPESRVALVLLLYFLGLRGLVELSHRQLVQPARGPQEFSALRARAYLENITALGPRAVGSLANEVLTVNYLLKQVKAIEMESNHAHKISVDIQRPTGTFSIDFLGGFTSYYDNITNVVVKLEPRNGAEHAILSNCHFDSVPNSPGASDDAVSCSVMLEVLQILSKSPESLKHAVVFLFNGAEESILQASHGFITQHPWAKSVRAFLNLEAAGVGGKELVFQTGPENPWLVQAYISAAKHPFASIVAQEVFQAGVIPADTDFRIYRDFGNIPGIDLAFIENGYIYHTKYDTADRILTDSIQRAGDNILGVLKYLAKSDYLAKSHEYRHGNVIFFDVFGMFVLGYPARVGAIMNCIITALTIIYVGKKILQSRKRAISYLKELAIAFGFTILSWFATLVAILIVAAFISIIGRSMSWYTHFHVSSFLYGTAAVAQLTLVHTLLKTFYYRVNFIYLTKSTKLIIVTLVTIFSITFILVCSGIFFPFSSDLANPRPKRIILQHLSRRFHDLDGHLAKSDSGIWVNGLDYGGISYVTPHIPELNDSIRTKCEEESPLCGMPWILPVDYLFRKNWYLPAPAFIPKNPIRFQLLSKEHMPWDSTKLTFEVSGPSHMSLYLRVHQGATLSKWSLGDGTPVININGDYFVYYSHGLQAGPWHFWIELKTSEEPTKGMVTLAIATHYCFGEDQNTTQLYALLERFPNWTFPSSWVSTYDQFVF